MTRARALVAAAVVGVLTLGGTVAYAAAKAPVSVPCTVDARVLTCTLPAPSTVTSTRTVTTTSRTTVTVTQPTTTATPTTVSTSASNSSTTAPTTTTTTTQPANTAMPVGDLPGWKQVLAEDFTTAVALGGWASSRYVSNFFAYNWCCDTNNKGLYAPAKTWSVSDGSLDAWLHTEGTQPYAAAVVVAGPIWGQLYGKYTVRLKADPIEGYKLVPLLWDVDDGWSFEVDFPEVNTLQWQGQPEVANINIYQASASPQWYPPVSTGVAPASGWHTYDLEWSPGRMTFVVDGKQVHTTTSRIPTEKMKWVLQFETAITGNAPSPAVQGHVDVDWVAMYSYAP